MKRYMGFMAAVIVGMMAIFASATIILAMGNSTAEQYAADFASVDPPMAIFAAVAATVVGILIFIKRNHVLGN